MRTCARGSVREFSLFLYLRPFSVHVYHPEIAGPIRAVLSVLHDHFVLSGLQGQVPRDVLHGDYGLVHVLGGAVLLPVRPAADLPQ